MAVTRHFHDWNQPCLPTAVSILCQDWVRSGHKGPLDLRHTLIIVPTRHAGRRLRAELARAAAMKNTAALTGPIVTPAHLLPPAPQAAPDSLALVLLARRLKRQQATLPALFPASGTDWPFDFALELAEQIQDVRRQLAEGDKCAADLLPLVPEEERARWEDLARLEAGLGRDLRKLGLEDPFQAMRRQAHLAPPHLSSVRVISLFVPDYSVLAAQALNTLSAQGPVDLHILAPTTEADRFDMWGRPIPACWENTPLPLDERQIHVFEQAPDEIDALSTSLQTAEKRGQALAVCMPDAENARALARRLQMENRPLYLPNGVPLSATAPGRLLSAWLTLRRTRTCTAAAQFLRQPDVQDWLRRLCPLSDSPDWLSQLDHCRSEHLPASFDDLLHFARAQSAYGALAQVLETLVTHMDQEIPAFLAGIYDCRQATRPSAAEPLFAEAAQALADLVATVTAAARQLELSAEESLGLLQTLLGRELVFPRPAADAGRETIGWLEIQWESSPALLLADMREGVIPENRIGDAFLPDSLRTATGLAGNREALARDLFLARALLASRPPGVVRFLYCRRAANQDPQLPSRLLLACPEAELPARVALLFERPALHAPLSAAPALPVLRLVPPACTPDQVPGSLSVTDFRAYLTCPFRFYLSRILRMAPLDDCACELDPLGFGTLAHDVLRLLKQHPALGDEAKIQGLLLAELDRLAELRLGPRPSLAIQVQLESLRQRLRQAARIHAESVHAGWRVISTEEKFEAELDGMFIRARLDRIDRHVADGRIRILDYKTADANEDPLAVHYQPRKQAWRDLQLPLYRFLYEQLHPRAEVSVGYFNLPKAVAGTRIAEFDFNSPAAGDLYLSAIAAAREVIANIRARRFWPPAAVPPDRDEFGWLFAGRPPLIQELPVP